MSARKVPLYAAVTYLIWIALVLTVAADYTRRSQLRGPRSGFLQDQRFCAVSERRYFPSALETKWLSAARMWKESGQGDFTDLTAYCKLLVETRPDIDRMLELVKELMQSNSTLSSATDADRVLSSFVTSMQCGPYRLQVKEHIEPLVAALRHPYAIPCPGTYTSRLPAPVPLKNDDYILLASLRGVVQSTHHKYYLDAGASFGYKASRNQWWMIETYEQRGIQLDRMIYWEAKQAMGSEGYKDVPPRLFPNFIHYNFPAPASLDDGRSPLAVVSKLATANDFVSIKIDIDTFNIEKDWVNAILASTSYPYAALIDEFFWECHFNFAPMKSSWGPHGVDTSMQLADALQIFQQLRTLGIRSHGWI